MNEILLASLIGLATTSSAMAGTAIGLYCPLSKRKRPCREPASGTSREITANRDYQARRCSLARLISSQPSRWPDCRTFLDAPLVFLQQTRRVNECHAYAS